MTSINLKLTDQDTRDEAVERLTTYFPFQADGYECTVIDRPILYQASSAGVYQAQSADVYQT
jgi:hypothetical protein